jgi:hypothetical protein
MEMHPIFKDQKETRSFMDFLNKKGVMYDWINGEYDDYGTQLLIEEFQARANNPTITRAFLAGLDFRVMDKNDFRAFAGVESPVPLIAYYNDKFSVIIDGVLCEILNLDTGEQVAICDDILAL